MFDQLYATVKERFGEGSGGEPMGEWICNNTKIKGRPFSFKHYEFQKAIADDMHPNLSVIKCSQIGLTEVQIRKFLAMLTRNTALVGIFSLPSEKLFTRIYNGRIKPIVESHEVFNPPSATQPVRKKDQIQIRNSFGYITGCTEGDATSTSADFLMHDELDLSPQDIIALYQSRLQGSEMKMTQAFSTPTFGGRGIDARYKTSDQHEYLVRCPSCNHYNLPRFTRDFVHIPSFNYEVECLTELNPDQIATLNLEDAYVCCEKCRRPLNLKAPELREWVARHPSRTLSRGYWVRPFSTSRIPLPYIFQQLSNYHTLNNIRGFWNTVLGETYDNADSQIQEEDIKACMEGPNVPEIPADASVYLGVDVGLFCHLTLSFDNSEGRPIFFHFETLPVALLDDRIQQLRAVYPIVQGAADRFPFEPTVDALRITTGNLIMPVQYRGSAMLHPVKNELGEITHYSADKTMVLDRIQAMVQGRNVTFCGYKDQKDAIITHLQDNRRVEDPEKPEAGATWEKTVGTDHYFHAIALNMLSRRIHEHSYTIAQPQIRTTPMLLAAQSSEKLGTLGNAGAKKISRMG